MTHGIGFLPQCDVITVVMANGQITEVGSYNELIENDGVFAQFLQNYQSTETNKDENGTTLQADFSVFPSITLSVLCGSFGKLFPLMFK